MKATALRTAETPAKLSFFGDLETNSGTAVRSKTKVKLASSDSPCNNVLYAAGVTLVWILLVLGVNEIRIASTSGMQPGGTMMSCGKYVMLFQGYKDYWQFQHRADSRL